MTAIYLLDHNLNNDNLLYTAFFFQSSSCFLQFITDLEIFCWVSQFVSSAEGVGEAKEIKRVRGA